MKTECQDRGFWSLARLFIIALVVALGPAGFMSACSPALPDPTVPPPVQYDNSTVIPGEWLIGLASPSTGELAQTYDADHLDVVIPDSVYLVRSEVRPLSTDYAFVEENRLWTLTDAPMALPPNDPLYAQQWHLPKIDAPGAWERTRGAPGVKICIVDTGRPTHSDLRVVLSSGAYGSADADGHGHSTHVAGIAAAIMDNALAVVGVGAGANILTYKALSDAGSGSTAAITAGIEWCRANGAQVINLSLGGPSPSQAMSTALANAVAAGAIPVCAGGNDGPSTAPGYPGSDDNCIGVAASGPNDEPASFTNRSSRLDVTAPGVGILSTCRGGGTCQMSGTSMSCPVVVGVLALGKAVKPSLGFQEAQARLRATGKVLTGVLAGMPRVNAGAFIVALGPPPTPTLAPATPTTAPLPTAPPFPTLPIPGPTPTPGDGEPLVCIMVGRDGGVTPFPCPVRVLNLSLGGRAP